MKVYAGRAPLWRIKEEVYTKDFTLPQGSIVCPIEMRHLPRETKKDLGVNLDNQKDWIACYTNKGMLLINRNNLEVVEY